MQKFVKGMKLVGAVLSRPIVSGWAQPLYSCVEGSDR